MQKFTDKYVLGRILLFSVICLAVFYTVWNEPTLPDDLSIISNRILNNLQNIKEKDKQIQALDSAKKVLDALLQKKPNDHSLRYSQGSYYSIAEDYPEAIAIHSRNLKALDSINDKIIYHNTKVQIAMNYYAMGEKLLTKDKNDTPAAVNTLLRSFDYVPYYEPSVINLAIIYIYKNQPDSARTLITECIKLHPDNAALYNTLGFSYYKEHNFKESENYFLQAHNLDPGNEDANRFLKEIQDQLK